MYNSGGMDEIQEGTWEGVQFIFLQWQKKGSFRRWTVEQNCLPVVGRPVERSDDVPLLARQGHGETTAAASRKGATGGKAGLRLCPKSLHPGDAHGAPGKALPVAVEGFSVTGRQLPLPLWPVRARMGMSDATGWVAHGACGFRKRPGAGGPSSPWRVPRQKRHVSRCSTGRPTPRTRVLCSPTDSAKK